MKSTFCVKFEFSEFSCINEKKTPAVGESNQNQPSSLLLCVQQRSKSEDWMDENQQFVSFKSKLFLCENGAGER